MIEVPRRVNVSGGREANIAGYLEEWYFRGMSQGIEVSNKELLEYPRFVGEGQGIFLGHFTPYGMVMEDKFYELSSYLFGGSIITYGKRREHFGTTIGKNPKNPLTPKVSEQMPEVILKIMAETEEKLAEISKRLHLPLEDLVTA